MAYPLQRTVYIDLGTAYNVADKRRQPADRRTDDKSYNKRDRWYTVD